MDNDEPLINTAAPFSLHPGVFEDLEGLTDDSRPFISGAVAAFTSAVNGLAAIDELRKAAVANTALTPEARILELSAFADRKVAEIAKQIDAADATLKKQIAFTESELEKPLEATVHSMTAAELRQLVRAMSAAERRKLVMDSIESNDMTVLGSVLAAHPLLSGLSAIEREEYTRRYREKSQPQLAQRLAIMLKTKELLNDRSGIVFKHAQKLVGASPSKVRELRDQQTKMQRALAR